MELIASGHGDNDFFMDPVRVKWPRHLVCFFCFFESRNECKGEHYIERGHLLNM